MAWAIGRSRQSQPWQDRQMLPRRAACAVHALGSLSPSCLWRMIFAVFEKKDRLDV
jgi:hypothetical protein